MMPRQRLGDRRSSIVLERDDGLIVGIGRIDEDAVKVAYRRWAPVYDHTFGRVSMESRRHAVEVINTREGRVLEVGVGTGLALADYGRHLEVVGIDLSPEMLDKARERVEEDRLDLDTVAAMFVMTVVPEPERVMKELARVTKPGGQVILVNHFSQVEGVRGWVERRMAPFADLIGWRSVFDLSRVMVCDDLELAERRALRPWGIFTMLRFSKRADARLEAAE
jgi:phosphatidylethanolamine/phosphatidyl-N-methylethanolamine N-methyltransferase